MCIQISMSNINFTWILCASYRLFRLLFSFSFEFKLYVFFSFFSDFMWAFVQVPRVIIYLLVYIISHMLFRKMCVFFCRFSTCKHTNKQTKFVKYSLSPSVSHIECFFSSIIMTMFGCSFHSNDS